MLINFKIAVDCFNIPGLLNIILISVFIHNVKI
ncbi:hypothetical protein PEC301877_28860 [Pectobacterium carotovorum subsp. carotovorum]|nr:hypothetical protein PEC301877_28860 [Pectobacterium carotovorum subsp. carotovorum]